MNRWIAVAVLVISVAACSRQEVRENVDAAQDSSQRAAENVRARLAGGGRADERMTAEQIAQARRDQNWRTLESFRRQSTPAPQSPASGQEPPVQFRSVPQFSESLESIDWTRLDQTAVSVPMKGDIEGPSVLKAQVLLDRNNFAPGVIDGRWGKNTEIAVHWFQRENGLQPTGEIDEATYRRLASRAGTATVLQSYAVTDADLEGPFTPMPEDVYEKAELSCLCHESVTERLAEKFHTTDETLAMLNPEADFANLRAGQTIRTPAVDQRSEWPEDAKEVIVSVEGNYLHVLDSAGRTILHAPTTVGSQYDPSPNEQLKITGIAFNPDFHYQPKLFADVPDEEPEAMLKPGPNSPVGVVWIQLSKDNYGIHGTSDPASIGYASSHGCIRLTNWSAAQLAQRSPVGIPVDFVDER